MGSDKESAVLTDHFTLKPDPVVIPVMVAVASAAPQTDGLVVATVKRSGDGLIVTFSVSVWLQPLAVTV